MQQSEELDLIARAQRGDHQAFRILVDQYHRFAYAVAFRITRNHSDADDITQEAFIKLWKHLGKYRTGIKLTTWLYQIVTNQCLDFLKSVNKKQQVRNTEMSVALPIADETSAEKKSDDRELLEVITTLASRLTPKQQAAFVLRDLEGLSVEEVCEILEMSPGTLKSNLYYARNKIREDLNLYYKELIKPRVV